MYNTPHRTCRSVHRSFLRRQQCPSPHIPAETLAKQHHAADPFLHTRWLYIGPSQTHKPKSGGRPSPIAVMSSHPSLTSTYRARASLPTTGPLASYLLSLISVKQTNLCLSADVETSAELLQLAEDVGDSICVLKTHCDIVVDWSDRTAQALREIAKRKWFLIFEDRKFADIGGMSCWLVGYSLAGQSLTHHRNRTEAVHFWTPPHCALGRDHQRACHSWPSHRNRAREGCRCHHRQVQHVRKHRNLCHTANQRPRRR